MNQQLIQNKCFSEVYVQDKVVPDAGTSSVQKNIKHFNIIFEFNRFMIPSF